MIHSKNTSTRPVLVVGSDHRIALTIARCLVGHGIAVDVAFPLGMATGSSSIRKAHVLSPLEDQQSVLEELLALIATENYDTLFPCNDLVLALFAAHFDVLSAAAKLACPSPESINNVLNKELTLQAARELGIRVPRTATADDSPLDATHDWRFPVIAKPVRKHKRSAAKVQYAESREELLVLLEGQDAPLDQYLVQEYCEGAGVGVEILMNRGEPIVAFQHLRVEELPATGGVSVLARAMPLDAALVKSSVELLRRLRWDGVAMVEFRVDLVRGRAVLMEVNGRYWGSLALSYEAGLEIPWYQWQLMHGQFPTPPQDYRIGARISWTAGRAERLLRYLQNRPPSYLYSSSPTKELVSFVKNLPPTTRDAVWRLNDRRAGVAEVRQMLINIVRGCPRGLRSFLKLPVRAKIAYLGSAVGVTKPADARQNFAEMRSVLVVCHGNIIRSAFAEGILKKLLRSDGVHVRSAGTNATASRADASAVFAAKDFDVDLSFHVPRALTAHDVEAADLIVAMDHFNVARIIAGFPGSRRKVVLLGSMAYGYYDRHHAVQDPFGSSPETFSECFAQIAGYAEAALKRSMESRWGAISALAAQGKINRVT